MRRLGGGAVLAAILSMEAAADTPRPATQIPARIPAVATELLRLEVSVTYPNGRPVPGLTAADFQIFEDGRPETITHFRPGTGGQPADDEDDDADEDRADAPAARHIVLAIDDLHVSAASLSGCKEALKRFLAEQVSDRDEVAMVTTSGGRGLYLAFTRERVMLRRAVDRLAYAERRGESGGRATMSEHEAESIDRGDATALGLATREISLRDIISGPLQTAAGGGQFVNPRLQTEAEAMARSIVAQALDTTNRTLATLEQVIRGLGAARGRKLLVLVSDGFLTGQGSQNPLAFDLRRIFDASARAGVSVYALHSRGLSAEPSGGGADKPPNVDQSAPAVRDSYRTAGALAERENLGALAEGTGGFLVHGTNDLSGALRSILRDSDGAYLLAYSPGSDDRDGRFRRIQVKVPSHPRLIVRSRHGYFAPDERRPAGAAVASADQAREQDLRRALTSLVPLRGVPLEMALDFVDLPPQGPQAVVRARVDLAGLPLATSGDRRQGELEVLGIVYDEGGQTVGEVEGHRVELDLSPATYSQLLREGLRFQRSVPLKPGSYQVRLVARERLSSQVGTAFGWVEVPARSPSALTLSSVFLFAEKEPAMSTGAAAGSLDALRDVQILRRFPRGGSLYYGLYVYDASRDAAGSTDVVLQAQVWSAGRLKGVSPLQPVSSAAGAPHPTTGRVVLEGLGPGEYELRVLVVDRKARLNAERRAVFTIG
jgi:VWFA-related protein